MVNDNVPMYLEVSIHACQVMVMGLSFTWITIFQGFGAHLVPDKV